jgi:pyruvate formate lyase activating enzyme
MKIGGFQPFTLSDFPGEIAAIVFVQGCNFRCPFCHNRSLLDRNAAAPEQLLGPDFVLASLRLRRCELTGVVISGGEPTLEPDLPAFLREVRTLGLKVKLDTNGSHPEVLEALLAEGLLDGVAMDIKAPWAKYAQLAGVPCDLELIRRSIALLRDSGIHAAFRTTNVTPLLTPEDINAIRRLVPPKCRYTVQRFVPLERPVGHG